MARTFPRAHDSGSRRRLAALVAVVALVLAGLSSPLAFADDLKDKQRDVKKSIKATNAQLQESSRALQAAAKQLQQAQVQLGTAQAKLAQTRGQLAVAQDRDRKMQAALDQAVRDLERARGDLLKGQEKVGVQRVAVGEMVANVYEQGDPKLAGLASILDASDPGDMTRSIATNESMVAKESSLLDELHAAEVLLTVQEGKVERKKGEVEIQRQAAAENLKLMQSLEAQAEAEEAAVRSLVSQKATALKAAQAAKRSDMRALSGLRAQESRITAELRRRAAEAKRRGGGARKSNGYLDYPVNGYISSPYGYRTHPIYGYYGLHNGVDFGADCGAPMRAGANGQVVSRGYDSVYGNYLILDHGYQAGVGLAARFNHATYYIVGEGQRVKRGQVVGYVGSTGWSTGCHLHFSTLANGNYTDPLNWM